MANYDFSGAINEGFDDIRRRREFADRMAMRKEDQAYKERDYAMRERELGNAERKTRISGLEIGLTPDVEEGLDLKADFNGGALTPEEKVKFKTPGRDYQMAQADDFVKRLRERKNPAPKGSTPDNLSELTTLYRTLEDKRRNDPKNFTARDKNLLDELDGKIRHLGGMGAYKGGPDPVTTPKPEGPGLFGKALSAGKDFVGGLFGGDIKSAVAAERARRQKKP